MDHSTRAVIPVARSVVYMACEPSPHVAAWFLGVSIRFTWSPVLVDWNRAIGPHELSDVRVPLEADPNIFRVRSLLLCQRQDEVVFFCTGNFHQLSPQCFAVCLGLLPGSDGVDRQITVAVEGVPVIGTS